MIGSDFNTFLKMLTVQMKNQDPLNPMESSEFAVQLATFASVEQQVRTNDLLRDMSSTSSSYAGFGSLLGKQVRVSGEIVLSGQGDVLQLPGNTAADTAVLTISTGRNGKVASFTVPTKAEAFALSGLDQNGNEFTHGLYQVDVIYKRGDEVLETVPATAVFQATELRLEGSDVFLVLGNGQEIEAADISGVLERSG